jgi:hypothetical protein
VDDTGQYLMHPDRDREFGSEHGRPDRIQNDFPEFTDLLGRSDTPPQVMEDRTGQRFGIGWETVQLAGGPRVTVIEANPYAALMSRPRSATRRWRAEPPRCCARCWSRWRWRAR